MSKNKSIVKSYFFTLLITVVIALFFMIGCSRTKTTESFNDKNLKSTEVSNNKIIEIKEKMFITQVNDVYLNEKDYLGKTIKLEGVFINEPYSDDGDYYYFVVRYGPGCCGNDGVVGFEIKWDKSKERQYPQINSWVESTGVLKKYEGEEYLYLDLISLNVLDKRGAENVVQ